ncbi:MAG: integrase [Hyphomicrobiales bacterium]|nr:MAG: integrase [Hyphomicrobiales bacterium]
MNDALNVRFAGPLTPYSGGLAAELARLGYPKSTARGHLEMWAHLSRWLANEQVPLSELTESEITRFLAVRRATRASLYSAAALAPGLEYLRRSDVVPRSAVAVAVTPVEVLLDQFRGYLQVERGLLEATAETYAYRVRPFLQRRVHGGVLELTSLNAADVSMFCSAALPALNVESAKSTITGLRALLRFLHVEGITAAPLSAAVPKVASWRLTGLPSGLPSGQVQRLCDACDRDTAVGRRDFAIVMLLVRLGLRCGEIAAMTLDDIDWHAGTLLVHGKGNRHDELPLPVDVGSALTDYLRFGRPAAAPSRSVFLRVRAPLRALSGASASTAVARAARRAGLGTVHAHRLRHTVACATLRAGASLDEVGQLLRHRSRASTTIYAKVDQHRLSELARPWPGSGGER